MDPKVAICSAQPCHYKDISTIVNQQFGDNYLNSKNPLQNYPVVIVALLNDEVIGFCSGKIEHSTGILDLLAVKPEHQKKGLGSTLFQARMERFLEHNIHQFKLFHWVTSAAPFPKIALQHGFQKNETHNNYWSKESLMLNYTCVECGPPPCTCQCEVYTAFKLEK